MKFIPIDKNNYCYVQDIYKEGINTQTATFETTIPDWDTWDNAHLKFSRILITKNTMFLGWAALTPVSKRHVYRGVAEVSVYVSKHHRGKGIGKLLMQKLIETSETNSIWTLQAGIMRANKSSIKLHLNCGFRIIGYRERIGKLNNEWLDNIILERRSKLVGI